MLQGYGSVFNQFRESASKGTGSAFKQLSKFASIMLVLWDLLEYFLFDLLF